MNICLPTLKCLLTWGWLCCFIMLSGGPFPRPLRAADRPADADVFLPSQSVVVLFPGIPGDLDSEKNYLDQLTAWLEFLGHAPNPPRQIYSFWEQSENLPKDSPIPRQIIKPRREEFLALGQRLESESQPVIFVIWGHAGMQGSEPVFHVRGPRLTPQDFKAVAARLTRTYSNWILWFRGSGGFARVLAAPNRHIMASDNDLAFTSDPIGLPLLLKKLSSSPTLSWPALGNSVGAAIVGWYEERHLARTEEPTLWLAGQSARPLAPVDKTAMLAETPSSPIPSIPPKKEIDSGANTITNWPAQWQAIARVAPSSYPGQDAVLLRQRINYTLGSDPALTMEQEAFIQVLAEAGKQYGDFDFTYSPPEEELNFQECEVLTPADKLVRLDPDEIRESHETGVGDYATARRKFFSLPGVAPGSVVHVRYSRAWKTYPLPHCTIEIPLAQELPILRFSAQISVPKESAFHFLFVETKAREPVLKQTEYSAAYYWEFDGLPARPLEVLAPPQQHPALLVSTFNDWAEFAAWYGRVSDHADEITPELAAKATELTRGAQTDLERIVAIYNYVTNLRYVAVPMGVNSFRPHAAAKVLQSQFGDCKDKANLLNTLLRSLKLDARLVLVPRFSQACDALPGFAFNHAISRITIDKRTFWADTTDEICRFGMLPPGDPGKKVLVIDGQSQSLIQLPIPAVKDHQLSLRGLINCESSNDAANITLTARTRGYPDYQLRTAARAIKERQANQPLLSVPYQPSLGVLAMDQQEFTATTALNVDFCWQASGRQIGILAKTGDRWFLQSPFWLPREWPLALQKRKAPLFLQEGYPLALDQQLEFHLPSSAQDFQLPPVRENTAEPFQWKLAWGRNGRNLYATLHVELARGELSESDSLALQTQMRALLSAVNTPVVFTQALPP